MKQERVLLSINYLFIFTLFKEQLYTFLFGFYLFQSFKQNRVVRELGNWDYEMIA